MRKLSQQSFTGTLHTGENKLPGALHSPYSDSRASNPHVFDNQPAPFAATIFSYRLITFSFMLS